MPFLGTRSNATNSISVYPHSIFFPFKVFIILYVIKDHKSENMVLTVGVWFKENNVVKINLLLKFKPFVMINHNHYVNI